MDIIAIGVANNSGGGGGGTPTDAYSKTETDALLKNKVGFAEYKDNKISLYDSSSKDNVIGEIDLPVDMVVDQIKTKFSQKFKFDSTTYPDTENPNLDGKPVLVLAIKTSATADTFSFLNMESLVDVYTGGTTKSAIISVDSETGVITNVVRISAETGNKIVQKDDGLFVPNQIAADVSYSNTTSKLKATTTQAAIDETLGVANSKYSKPETGIPSTDMTQAVKDSLGKANTALQAADKTELQENINAKLDKTSVLSDFSSSELTNKVPSARLVLDSFTKKVTTEAVDNNTRIITVPENVDCFAGIGMIGGKTQKIVQLANPNKSATFTSGGVTFTFVNKYTWTMSNSQTSAIINTDMTASNITLIKDHKYFLGNLGLSSGMSLQLHDAASSTTLRIPSGSVSVVWTATISTNTAKITLLSTSTGAKSGTFTIQLFDLTAMFGSGKEPTAEQFNAMFTNDYYEYDTALWNAPVTEITSVGKNLFNSVFYNGVLTLEKDYTNTNELAGKVDSVVGLKYVSFGGYFKKGTYTLSYTNDAWFSFNRVAIAGTGAKYSAIQIRRSYTWTQDIDGYTYFSIECDDSETGTTDVPFKYAPNIQIERGSTVTDYSPSNKTTISLDTIVNNLPDYGASAVRSDGTIVMNELDLENGVYHHRVKKLNGSELKTGWETSSVLGGVFWCSSPSDTVVTTGSKGIICNLYNTLSGNYDQLGDGELFMNDAGFSGVKRIVFKDSKYPNTTDGLIALKSKINADAVFYYETSEPEDIPISSILPPIHVEPNGTLEFVNEHNLDVPSKTIYKKTV